MVDPYGVIANEWRCFAQTVLPKGVGEVQRVETRRAFYAGAAAMFGVLMRHPGSDDELFEVVVREFADWRERLERGEV